MPGKGRLREPALRLLHDAGLTLEDPGERSLLLPCRGLPVDVMLVRAADVPEYVQDGVVDCGITGADLVAERGAKVSELLRLGFGRCDLVVAVPDGSPVEQLAELAGATAATVFPRLAAERLAERGVPLQLVEVSGSVEVAPRLGLADAVVDLVSTGGTMAANGLRPVAELFRSEAVLLAGPTPDERATRLASMLGSVVAARGTRYVMMNAPETALDAICALVPGSRAPTVLRLAEPGMLAVHVLVPADGLWDLLPRLEAAGASAILVVPVERMLG